MITIPIFNTQNIGWEMEVRGMSGTGMRGLEVDGCAGPSAVMGSE